MKKCFLICFILPFLITAQNKDSIPSIYINISFDYLNLQSSLTSIYVTKYNNRINTSRLFKPNTSIEFGMGIKYKIATFNIEYLTYSSEYSGKNYYNYSMQKYKLEGSIIKPNINLLFNFNPKLSISVGGGLSFISFKLEDTFSNIYGTQGLTTFSGSPTFKVFYLTTGFELSIFELISFYTKADYYFNNDIDIKQNENKGEVVTANETINHFDFSNIRANIGIRLYLFKSITMASNRPRQSGG